MWDDYRNYSKKFQTSFHDILCSSVVEMEPKMVNTVESAQRVF